MNQWMFIKVVKTNIQTIANSSKLLVNQFINSFDFHNITKGSYKERETNSWKLPKKLLKDLNNGYLSPRVILENDLENSRLQML